MRSPPPLFASLISSDVVSKLGILISPSLVHFVSVIAAMEIFFVFIISIREFCLDLSPFALLYNILINVPFGCFLPRLIFFGLIFFGLFLFTWFFVVDDDNMFDLELRNFGFEAWGVGFDFLELADKFELAEDFEDDMIVLGD